LSAPGVTWNFGGKTFAARSTIHSRRAKFQGLALLAERQGPLRGGEAANARGKNLASASTVEPTRRDFLFIATGAMAAVGAAAVVWPLISQMSPDASTLAMASTEVDIGSIPVGQIVTIKWRGKPVFISHRSPKEIEEAQNVDLATLRDPQPDSARVQKPEWLIVIGVCTHLGCIPMGHQGDYNGWFCPCHGSVYDTSGRIRKGPAPLNLAVPEYSFLTDTKVKIG
jgi:ubiquinol-cytochrome c reductase iron-sulfur subunit